MTAQRHEITVLTSSDIESAWHRPCTGQLRSLDYLRCPAITRTGWLEDRRESKVRIAWSIRYCSFAYSDFAAMRMGISGSASFHSSKKSWKVFPALAVSPASAEARARPR